MIRIEREELPDDSLLPAQADSLTIFVNPRSEYRQNITACFSFDQGKNWSGTRTIWPGCGAYSSMAYSPFVGRFYLIYEKGEKHPYELGISVAEFDLEWLLKG